MHYSKFVNFYSLTDYESSTKKKTKFTQSIGVPLVKKIRPKGMKWGICNTKLGQGQLSIDKKGVFNFIHQKNNTGRILDRMQLNFFLPKNTIKRDLLSKKCSITPPNQMHSLITLFKRPINPKQTTPQLFYPVTTLLPLWPNFELGLLLNMKIFQ